MIGVDLHYLLTYWGRSAEDEQLVTAWTMRQLQMNSILDRSFFPVRPNGPRTRRFNLTASNFSIEDIMRVWDALAPKYRLSIAYTARTVRLDTDTETAGPVVTTRMIYGARPGRATMPDVLERRILGAFRMVSAVTATSIDSDFARRCGGLDVLAEP